MSMMYIEYVVPQFLIFIWMLCAGESAGAVEDAVVHAASLQVFSSFGYFQGHICEVHQVYI
jgi:hypothetical protein